MFGFIRKKTVLEKMKEIKDSNKKEKLFWKYPHETEKQKNLNIYSAAYEDGTANFYNAMKSFIEKQ